jgi:hypothetical protein
MRTAASWLVGFARFWYRFIVGDDWTLAATAVVALSVTDLLQRRGISAWWLLPVVVVGAVGVSLLRASPVRPPRRRQRDPLHRRL